MVLRVLPLALYCSENMNLNSSQTLVKIGIQQLYQSLIEDGSNMFRYLAKHFKSLRMFKYIFFSCFVA